MLRLGGYFFASEPVTREGQSKRDKKKGRKETGYTVNETRTLSAMSRADLAKNSAG
jgi:hypothetical protein